MVMADYCSFQASSASWNIVVPSTMAASLFSRLMLVACTFAQSVALALPSSNSCVKRSVIVYTSDSSTYFVIDVGTSSFPSTPTFCANASVSTVVTTQPVSSISPNRLQLRVKFVVSQQDRPMPSSIMSPRHFRRQQGYLTH
jgi:hypothetical protein